MPLIKGAAVGGGKGSYKYLVEKDGTNITVYDKDGNTAYGPVTSPAVAINWALSNLTSGRTWKERVVVEGNFTLDAKILVPSYTVLDLTNAKFTLADGVNDHMLSNSDTTGGNTHIDIIGGVFDGNKANNTGDLAGIYLDHVDNCTVKDCIVKNCSRWDIRLRYATYCHVYGCNCSDAGQHGIMVAYHVYYNVIENNICYDNGNHGISLEQYAEHNTIIGNVLTGNVKGLVVETPPNRYNDIIGNIVNNNGHGILVYGAATSHVRFCNFIGNVVSNNTAHGLYLSGYVSHCNVIGNVCVGNSRGTGADNTYDNIYLRNGSSYNNIQGNICRAGINTNKPRYGINIGTSDCTGNLVINNDIYDDGYGTAPFNDAGTDTIENNNRGNVGLYLSGDYNADWSGFPPAGLVPTNGTRVIVHNTNGGATVTDRLYCYSNGSWHYVDLT